MRCNVKLDPYGERTSWNLNWHEAGSLIFSFWPWCRLSHNRHRSISRAAQNQRKWRKSHAILPQVFARFLPALPQKPAVDSPFWNWLPTFVDPLAGVAEFCLTMNKKEAEKEWVSRTRLPNLYPFCDKKRDPRFFRSCHFPLSPSS